MENFKLKYSRGGGPTTEAGTLELNEQLLELWGVELNPDGTIKTNVTLTCAQDGDERWICPGPSKVGIQVVRREKTKPVVEHRAQFRDLPGSCSWPRTGSIMLPARIEGDILIVTIREEDLTEPARCERGTGSSERGAGDILEELKEALKANPGTLLKVLVPGSGFMTVNPHSIRVVGDGQ